MKQPDLEIRNVEKSFSSKDKVLKGVSLNIKKVSFSRC